MSITVDIPRPWVLTANQRLHWREKARRTKWIREFLTWRAANHPRLTGQQHCTVTIAWPDRRRRDDHNLMPTIKACIDGIVDAGVLVDDSHAHLIGPDLRVADELCAKQYACVLTFEFVAVAA